MKYFKSGSIYIYDRGFDGILVSAPTHKDKPVTITDIDMKTFWKYNSINNAETKGFRPINPEEFKRVLSECLLYFDINKEW